MIQLGGFRLIKPVARGGMGEVWRGQHIASGAPVANARVSLVSDDGGDAVVQQRTDDTGRSLPPGAYFVRRRDTGKATRVVLLP